MRYSSGGQTVQLTHITADLAGVDAAVLDDASGLLEILLDAVRRAGLSPVSSCQHKFEPHGVSAVVLIAESHLSIHTWPVEGNAALDLFTCGPRDNALDAVNYVRERLAPTGARTQTIERGI
jgi:S-adenosylmethionine decarboxylase